MAKITREQYGRALKTAYENSGFKSFRALSEAIGVHPGTALKWSKGINKPQRAHQRLLNRHLKVDHYLQQEKRHAPREKQENGGVAPEATPVVEPVACRSTSTPLYYQLPLVDANGGPADIGDVVDHYALNHWRAGALTHIVRAGHKAGESEVSAIANALTCLTRDLERMRLSNGR